MELAIKTLTDRINEDEAFMQADLAREKALNVELAAIALRVARTRDRLQENRRAIETLERATQPLRRAETSLGT